MKISLWGLSIIAGIVFTTLPHLFHGAGTLGLVLLGTFVGLPLAAIVISYLIALIAAYIES